MAVGSQNMAAFSAERPRGPLLAVHICIEVYPIDHRIAFPRVVVLVFIRPGQ